jgi:hypothetical protein
MIQCPIRVDMLDRLPYSSGDGNGIVGSMRKGIGSGLQGGGQVRSAYSRDRSLSCSQYLAQWRHRPAFLRASASASWVFALSALRSHEMAVSLQSEALFKYPFTQLR